ncbi:fruit-body specific protein a [Lentinula edodes]|uniref:Fruit-body specific protein a n=1 Tax=Lentinula edodes TaxID=5353 RepID=A0A1Q3ETJ9_LENED|nr:fruit-body specific protein a [Lentinula edodes]
MPIVLFLAYRAATTVDLSFANERMVYLNKGLVLAMSILSFRSIMRPTWLLDFVVSGGIGPKACTFLQRSVLRLQTEVWPRYLCYDLRWFDIRRKCPTFDSLFSIDVLIFVIWSGRILQSPTQWPPIFDEPWRADSLSDFWAKRWHQLFRHFFIGLGLYIQYDQNIVYHHSNSFFKIFISVSGKCKHVNNMEVFVLLAWTLELHYAKNGKIIYRRPISSHPVRSMSIDNLSNSSSKYALFNSLSGLLNCSGLPYCGLIYPAFQGVPASNADPYNFNGTSTDANSIASTAFRVNQKSGATTNAPPNLPAANTTVTAVDGDMVIPVSRRSLSSIRTIDNDMSRRTNSDYEQVFGGTGTESEDRDAAIIGTAYLTYTLVSNSTYNVGDCLAFCDATAGCVFVNRELFMFGLQLVLYLQHSNLKCAAYGDVHSAEEKLNFGSQSLSGTPDGPLTYIQQSSGWTSKSFGDPSTPEGYDPLPDLGGANEAPGYMGFVFLNKYDVDACAAICNAQDPDDVGGSCKYFNIWRAVVDGVPTTYTCALYYIPADTSTAINYGQGNLTVTQSRGYKRITYVLDGGFEDYACDGLSFCYTDTTAGWLASSPKDGYYDASIFHYQPYAHSGEAVALLGSATGHDNYSGMLTYGSSLSTEAGVRYVIEFFHSSFYSGREGEVDAFVEVYWNGSLIGTIRPGYSQWKYYKFEVVGQGNDELYFRGGKAPSYDFIDDIFVMQA